MDKIKDQLYAVLAAKLSKDLADELWEEMDAIIEDPNTLKAIFDAYDDEVRLYAKNELDMHEPDECDARYH